MEEHIEERTLGDLLHARRRELRHTQIECAAALGCDQAAVSRMERGLLTPWKYRDCLAEYLSNDEKIYTQEDIYLLTRQMQQDTENTKKMIIDNQRLLARIAVLEDQIETLSHVAAIKKEKENLKKKAATEAAKESIPNPQFVETEYRFNIPHTEAILGKRKKQQSERGDLNV